MNDGEDEESISSQHRERVTRNTRALRELDRRRKCWRALSRFRALQEEARWEPLPDRDARERWVAALRYLEAAAEGGRIDGPLVAFVAGGVGDALNGRPPAALSRKVGNRGRTSAQRAAAAYLAAYRVAFEVGDLGSGSTLGNGLLIFSNGSREPMDRRQEKRLSMEAVKKHPTWVQAALQEVRALYEEMGPEQAWRKALERAARQWRGE